MSTIVYSRDIYYFKATFYTKSRFQPLISVPLQFVLAGSYIPLDPLPIRAALFSCLLRHDTTMSTFPFWVQQFSFQYTLIAVVISVLERGH